MRNQWINSVIEHESYYEDLAYKYYQHLLKDYPIADDFEETLHNNLKYLALSSGRVYNPLPQPKWNAITVYITAQYTSKVIQLFDKNLSKCSRGTILTIPKIDDNNLMVWMNYIWIQHCQEPSRPEAPK